MRVFRDYWDYWSNKQKGENGITQKFLDDHYCGDLEIAKKDNETNIDCFNCVRCKDCIGCITCAGCRYCIECDDCSHCDKCVSCYVCTYCISCCDCDRCAYGKLQCDKNQ